MDGKLPLLATAAALLLLVASARAPRSARAAPLDPWLLHIAVCLIVLVGMMAIGRFSEPSSDGASAVRGPERRIEVQEQVVRVFDPD